MVVIPEAAGEEFKPTNDRAKIDKILDKYYIDRQYILHIGTLNPRKNLDFLIKVFNRVHQVVPDVKLVITGKKGWHYQSLFELVEKLGLQKDVIFTGYILDEEAPYLYNGASVYAFPSIYEGFGLPPLEAMSCGTPVVASNTSSIPEVVGDAGVLLSPHDSNGWTKALVEILKNPTKREKLGQMALVRAKQFSWKKTAEKTAQVYEEVLKDL
jgi:glycosyltransferase involved in cell wall biosynthesis